jgi:hypothetical protein
MKNLLLLFSAGMVLLLQPLNSSGQAPSFGTAETFVLFTSIGAVGNNGISQITGNVGTNNGAITGFGNVNGTMHNANLTTNQAAAELIIAYNILNSTVANFAIAPLIGNGDTLEAGVYDVAGVSTLSNVLYLDAQGDPNAIFVFKMSAAFSSNPNAKVVLLNGASACNVFWKVEGAVNLGTGTFMRGNIVANSGAITLAANDTLEGRALSTTGAINLTSSLAYIPAGCLGAPDAGPVAPTLGTAECYTLFSGDGAVANAGVTFVTGDVGTNVGETLGFDALNVTGTIHPKPDVSTALAAADVVTAYTYLNVLPHDIELLYPAQFGNDLVLTANTYLLNAATQLNGNLYLNAEGNPDAVFVIKINGALSAGTESKVILMNGAQSNNVYWKVDGAASLNTYAVFHGTLIVNQGAINLTTGDSLYGRAFTTSGALNATAITAISPKVTCSALPVTWLYFKGNPAGNQVQLEWSTTAEVNHSFYTLEKSSNGVTFKTLARVNENAPNGNTKNVYTYTDMQPDKIGYYRIGQTDKDGKTSVYKTILVRMNESAAFHAFQYVQGSKIVIQSSGAVPGNGVIRLNSMDGTQVASQAVMLTKEASNYSLNTPNKKGVYILTIINNNKIIHTAKVMVL